MQSIDENQFQANVLDGKKVVVVDYGAEWCGPCKKLKPILADLSESMAEQADFFYVDAGEQAAMAQKYGVMSLPTILFFKNGELKDRVVGLVARDKIVNKIESLV